MSRTGILNVIEIRGAEDRHTGKPSTMIRCKSARETHRKLIQLGVKPRPSYRRVLNWLKKSKVIWVIREDLPRGGKKYRI